MEHSHPSFTPVSSRDFAASSSTIQTVTRLKVGKPAQIDVPSNPALQSQGTKVNTPSPVRRKPLPTSVSSPPLLLPRFSTGGRVVAVGTEEFNDVRRPAQIENLGPLTSHRPPWLPEPTTSPTLVVRDLDQFPRGHSPQVPQSPDHTSFADLPADKARQILQNLDRANEISSASTHSRMTSDPAKNSPPRHSPRPVHQHQRSITMPVRSSTGPPPLRLNGEPRVPLHRANGSSESNPPTKANMLTTFFGWKGASSSPVAESSPTTISDRSHSPLPSPRVPPSPLSFPSSIKSIPHMIDITKANGAQRSSFFGTKGMPAAPPTPSILARVEELEEELREISAELAGSIRREMELEDQVERLQLEVPPAQAPAPSRRTSDYFSDSGTSSVRYQNSEGDGGKVEDLEKQMRKSDQEKAQLKVDLSQKLQEERGRRTTMEAHIRSLEDHIYNMEQKQGMTANAPARIQELETGLEDNRRRMLEERRQKENYEDLLKALRVEEARNRNERDNLRDEVVPQLRARVEGLEAEAVEFQKLAYENARMQQELQSLRNLNAFSPSSKIGMIAEEGPPPTTPAPKAGLARSTSVARATPSTAGLARSGSLSRSNSVSKDRESRESLADRVKEIEMQRDALHRALKSLLERQKYQAIEHDKRTRALEQERDRALESHSPRRRGYEIEVKDLRYEINNLRRRADEALEQKWQCEKGLGGLKKDLDRAEQETGSLRALLHENDILIPDPPTITSSEVRTDTHATSASLERAYKELQETQALSIGRLRELKGLTPSSSDDAQTTETLDLLLKTMSAAEAERDHAQKQAATYRAQAATLHDTSTFHSSESASLAAQLRASADRVTALSAQVRYQLDSNGLLRTRLAEAVGRGERDQKASALRINNLQGKLKALEDRLMAAQQHSEEAVSVHEDELRGLRDNTNPHLLRLRAANAASSSSPRASLFPTATTTATSNMGVRMSPRSPRSPMLQAARSPRSPMLQAARSPRLGKTSSGIGVGMNEALRTEFLQKRVEELEGALAEAEEEIREVVRRMNEAQVEVGVLQAARDEAMKSTRLLQGQIVAENEKVGGLMRFLPIYHSS